ncbi:MAG TPA: hypothetical protein VFM46_03885, partial [Pseudomonadales bacterium]|nr:hypothetical protein [Pseudomonadales bacterium]
MRQILLFLLSCFLSGVFSLGVRADNIVIPVYLEDQPLQLRLTESHAFDNVKLINLPAGNHATRHFEGEV